MSDETRERLAAGIDLAWKILTPIGLLALFFLKSQFATKEELDVLALKLVETNTALRVMAEQNKVAERHERSLADLEIRVRGLEARRP